MISKGRFVRVLNFIKKMHEVEEEVNAAFRRNKMEFNSFSFCDYENELFELLAECSNDKYDWICWWIYDTDCGKDIENGRLYAENEDGSKIDMTTPEKLYDYLAKDVDKDQNV